jgi:acetyl esterase/lipase
MTDFEDVYRQLLEVDPSHRRRWLLDHPSVDISPAHWWFAFVDSAVSDVRREQRDCPQTRPRADAELAAALIEWALKENFPIKYAIENLVQLVTITLAAGRRPDALPANAQPDNVARLALTRFGFTRSQAVARAMELRGQTPTDDDYFETTDDYKDYHRLLGIQQMLDDLKPITGLLTDTDLVAQLEAWSQVLPELDPVPIDPMGQPPAPLRRIGIVGTGQASADGRRRLLTVSDGASALVDPDLTDEQLAERYGLDHVVTAPVINFCAAIHLDGPLAGRTGYAINELGHRIEIALPPRPGGPIGVYEVTRLATDDQPAELRFVGFGCPVPGATKTGPRTLPGMAAVPDHLKPFVVPVEARTAERLDTVDLYPPDSTQPRPAIVFVPGGPLPQPVLPRPWDWPVYQAYGSMAATMGAVGLIVNHRLYDPTAYPLAAADVVAAVELARTDPRVDADRVAIWFFSGGGMLMADWLRTPPAWLRCVAASYPLLGPFPGWPVDPRFSPAEAVTAAGSLPIVLTRVGGERPEIAATVEEFVTAARASGASLEIVDVPNGRHSFDVLDDTDESREAIERAFDLVLTALG